MAEESREFIGAKQNFIKSAFIFENELKEKLRRNKQHWLAAGENGTKLHKLSNSLHYWKSKLKPAVVDTSIVITLFNKEHDVRVELVGIIDAIEKLDESFHVKGVATFRNPRYICIYFESREVRDKVVEQFRMIDDNFVVYMHWALDNVNNVHSLKVHWLPITFDLDMIKQELSKFVECVEEERKKLVFLSGRDMPLGKLEFKVKLKKDVPVEKIPHVMEIGKMEALITIAGRQSLCLNCDCLGHISKNCKLRFCSVCRTLKLKGHDCSMEVVTSSYANIVKGFSNAYGEDPKDWGDDEVIIEKSEVNKDKILLSKKIAALEGQVEKLQNSQDMEHFLRKDKKRKAESVGPDAEDSAGSVVDLNVVEEEDIENASEEQENNDTEDSDLMPVDKEKAMEINVKKKKVKRKKKSKNQEVLTKKNFKSKQDMKNDENNLNEDIEPIIRSYGKPILNNARKRDLEKKFNKIAEVREFVFED